jgi:hypothetical protein
VYVLIFKEMKREIWKYFLYLYFYGENLSNRGGQNITSRTKPTFFSGRPVYLSHPAFYRAASV